MEKKSCTIILTLIIYILFLTGCLNKSLQQADTGEIRVIAVESFLADIAQNVAGDRIQVESLISIGIDPHVFEPTPSDMIRLSDAQMIIANGAGFEAWLQEMISNTGGSALVVEASAGLKTRAASEGETGMMDPQEVDPHYWMDPINVITYVENIRDGLIKIDRAGTEEFTQNADGYISKLKGLDQFISEQVAVIPEEHRVLVTNHESFGYFADRYDFKIIGSIIPSVSSGATPSAQQMALLVKLIRETDAKVIFLETGANPQLADQIASETGIKVVTGLYTHSVTVSNGEAPSYIDMMKFNTRIIVDNLK